jgi:hypothetical protein
MSLLERKDFTAIAASTFADMEHRGSKPAMGFSIRMTSGTSNNDPLMLVFESVYTTQGVNRGAERFLLHHGLLTLRLGNVLQVRTGDVPNARVLMVDPTEVSPAVCALVADFAPDRGYAFPTLIMQLARQLDEKTRRGIKVLSLGGECLTDAHARFFAEWLPDTRVSLVYVASEIGAISDGGCGYLPRNHYHPKKSVGVDIQNVDANGVGDLVISARITEHTKVDGYRIGDVACWVSESCPCGNLKTFEVLGRRGYDYIKLGQAVLRQEEFDRVAALCKDLYDDYRVEASVVSTNLGVVGSILLHIYKESGGGAERAAADIVARVSEHLFVSPTKTLGDFVKLGLLLPLRVEWASEPFPKGVKNVKLKQVSN